ncbi:hypothetical protein ILUMI_04928 [Ignelater luminosus]|uniref:Reverse transcriptase domain-containing protein n=1 Tax=Ignelater luminosus TaxID=2038154 RepID=A0A8K0GJ48_IGNLU|nr:hypothetical protein ILUMI_04928 [Ignelater luminosus]
MDEPTSSRQADQKQWREKFLTEVLQSENKKSSHYNDEEDLKKVIEEDCNVNLTEDSDDNVEEVSNQDEVCSSENEIQKARKTAAENLVKQAKKMKATSDKSHPPANIGDKGKGDLRNIIGVILQTNDEVATKAFLGVLNNVLLRNDSLTLEEAIEQAKIIKKSQEQSKQMGSTGEGATTVGMFTTMHVTCGFYQIVLDKESSDLCVFGTPYGQYKFLRLPYGISSAPKVFQERFKQIFRDCKGTDIYIDDIIIWGKDEEEHNRRLQKVLEIARKSKVKFNLDKCRFGKSSIKYMGHNISTNGIECQPKVIDVVKYNQFLNNNQQVQERTFNHKCIRELSEIQNGTKVVVQLKPKGNWIPAVLVRKLRYRTYVVKTNNGSEYVRNRIFIEVVPNTKLNPCLSDSKTVKREENENSKKCYIDLSVSNETLDNDVSDNNEEGQSDIENSVSDNNNVNHVNPLVTRTGRVVKPPDRLNL